MPFQTQAQAAAASGLTYKGTWNASTNTPTLVSSVGTNGDYYIVSVAGSTNLNGITSWGVGDWAIFNGATNEWQKIDNSDDTSWQLDGNTLSGEKWFGTISNHDVPMRANNGVRAKLLAAGGVEVFKYLISNGNGDISTNVSIGANVLDSNTTGHSSIAIGNSVLTLNTTGHSNTAVGYFAMSANVTGIQNTAFGDNAGQNSLGNGNVFLGYAAGQNETGSNKLYIANSNTSTPIILGDFTTNFLGFGVSPTARLHAKGVAVNYIMKLDTSADDPAFHVNNTGDAAFSVTTSSIVRLRVKCNANDNSKNIFDLLNSDDVSSFRVRADNKVFMGTGTAGGATLNIGDYGLSNFLYFGNDGIYGSFTRASTGLTFSGFDTGSGGTTQFILNSDLALALPYTAYFKNGIGIGTQTFGTNAAQVLAMLNGTAPTTSPANTIQAYAEGGVWKYRDSSGNIIVL